MPAISKIMIENGDTVAGFCSRVYSTVEGMFYLLQDNPSLDLDTDLTPGEYLNVRSDIVILSVPPGANKVIEPVYKYVTVENGQNLSDIAIQEYGSLEGKFRLIEDNPQLLSGVSPTIKGGDVLKIYLSKVTDIQLLNYYKRKSIRPNTGGNVPPSGIGYMQIESSFIVS